MNVRVAVRLARPVLLVLLTACEEAGDSGAGSGETYGPLAVVPTRDSGMDALLSGTLVISDECVAVRVRGNDEEYLLVWPEEAVSWDSDSRTVHFEFGGNTSELSDGDEVEVEVEVGGGEGPAWAVSKDGQRGDSIEWVSEPDPSCPAKTWWVSGV